MHDCIIMFSLYKWTTDSSVVFLVSFNVLSKQRAKWRNLAEHNNIGTSVMGQKWDKPWAATTSTTMDKKEQVHGEKSHSFVQWSYKHSTRWWPGAFTGVSSSHFFACLAQARFTFWWGVFCVLKALYTLGMWCLFRKALNHNGHRSRSSSDVHTQSGCSNRCATDNYKATIVILSERGGKIS